MVYEKEKTNKYILTNNLYMVRMLFKISPTRIIAELFYSILDYGGKAFLSVVFMKYIINVANEGRDFTEILIFMTLCSVGFFIGQVYMSWLSEKYRPISDQVIYYEFNKILFEKAYSVDMSCYENTDFFNKYTLATTEASTRAVSVLQNLSEVFSATLSSIVVIFIMASIDSVVAYLCFFPLIGNFIIGKIYTKLDYDQDTDANPHYRIFNYVTHTILSQKFAKEFRLSNIFSVLKTNYDKSIRQLNKIFDKYKKRIFVFLSMKDLFLFPFVFQTTWVYAAYRALVLKNITVGEFILLANTIVSATWMLINLSQALVVTSQNEIYTKNLKNFMEYEEIINGNQTGKIPSLPINTLELKNVSFTYTGQTKPVLKNINMTIQAGESIALVGHNGAGKTTLVKLLMRLYDPTEGEILLDGINIKEFDVKAYRYLFGTVFQDYQIFSMTVLENSLMGEVLTEQQRETALDALKRVGIYNKVSTLSHAEDTTLTREFDDMGAVLSGGEFQKIAISRVFAKNSSILILDEPSSALDPVAEYEMYETLDKSYKTDKKEKIVIIISHRVSSVVSADHIFVLENGQLVESGSHSDLMSMSGSYAEIFMLQAKSYIESGG